MLTRRQTIAAAAGAALTAAHHAPIAGATEEPSTITHIREASRGYEIEVRMDVTLRYHDAAGALQDVDVHYGMWGHTRPDGTWSLLSQQAEVEEVGTTYLIYGPSLIQRSHETGGADPLAHLHAFTGGAMPTHPGDVIRDLSHHQFDVLETIGWGSTDAQIATIRALQDPDPAVRAATRAMLTAADDPWDEIRAAVDSDSDN